MTQKVKVTLSLDEDLVETLDALSRETKKPRSRVVQEALRQWRKKELHGKLDEGYQAMADEDRQTALRNLPAFREVIK
jgi:metal-responsive CopG/Arc/MetJ family transcriptional regulator